FPQPGKPPSTTPAPTPRPPPAAPDPRLGTPLLFFPPVDLLRFIGSRNYGYFVTIPMVFRTCACPVGTAQNKRGSSAGPSAILSSCGYFARSGSGTFTFTPLSMAINSSAFTTALP